MMVMIKLIAAVYLLIGLYLAIFGMKEIDRLIAAGELESCRTNAEEFFARLVFMFGTSFLWPIVTTVSVGNKEEGGDE